MTHEFKSTAPQKRRRFGPGRSKLRSAIKARGRRIHNLWYLYSPRLKRDVVLRSDAEFAHFCFVEADPTVLRYELEPPPVTVVVGDEAMRTQFDAFVEFRGAPPELREIKTSEDSLSGNEERQRVAQQIAAAKAGFRYVRITKADLAAHAQLIRNWRCAIAFQAACREDLLTPFEDKLLTSAGTLRNCSLEELLQDTEPGLRSKYLAALFSLIQNAKLHSDIAAMPLSGATRLWTPEVGHA